MLPYRIAIAEREQSKAGSGMLAVAAALERQIEAGFWLFGR